jgi:hypothetical protein
MPKVCEPCGYYSAENTPTACPTCGSGLRFTLLPPQGQAAAPLPIAEASATSATARARAKKEGFLESMGISEINPRYLWAGFLIVVAAGGFFARSYQTSQALEQVRPGMHISQAARLIDGGDGYYDDRMSRFRDNFAADDRSSGAFEYQDGPHHMIIRWKDGIVTHVEKKANSGGGLSEGSITIIEGDDD